MLHFQLDNGAGMFVRKTSIMCTMGNPNEIRLAIVDNDDFVLMGLAAFLSRHLPNVRLAWKANTGTDALEYATDPANEADILLVDMSLEDMPGDMVCREIRSRNRMLPLLAVTSFSLIRYARRAAEGGAQGIVSKADFPALCKAVKLVSDGHTLCVRVGGETIGFEDVDAAYHRLVRLPVNRIERLSEREKYAMELYSQSYKPTQIARMMDVSAGTAKTYLDRVQNKLHLTSRAELIAYWWRRERW